MKNSFFSMLLIMISYQSNAQYTAVPDTVFEQYLIDEGIDSEGTLDGQFLTVDAMGVTELLIDNLVIASLTGIEAFIDLERLDARNNNFTTVDLSQNLALNQLTISNGPLNSINITQNTNLNTCIIVNCQLTTIDVSNNTNLIQLSLDENQLSTIDVTNLVNLNNLSLEDNVFAELEVSIAGLTGLFINGNNIVSIDLSALVSLETLNISENSLTQLNVSNNSQLEGLFCSENQLTALDLSNNHELIAVNCSNNQLTSLTVSAHPDLLELLCANNQLSSVDTSQMPLLRRYYPFGNQLTTLDTSGNPEMTFLAFYDNLINTPLDFSANPLLEWLIAYDNPTPSVNVTFNPNLTIFDFRESLLSNADLSNNPLLETIRVDNSPNIIWADVRNGNNNILAFNAFGCPNLTCVYVDDVSSGEGSFFIDSHTTLVNNEQECEDLGVAQYVNSNLQLFPNPTSSVVQLFLDDYPIQSITLYDGLGRQVVENNNETSMDLTVLHPGIYYMTVEVENVRVTRKLVKL